MPQRYRKSSRIGKSARIRDLFRRGSQAGDHRLRLIGLPNDEDPPLRRAAVIVSRKHGNAVKRNRIKRLCREAFRLTQAELPDGTDWLLLPRLSGCEDLEALRESLRTLAPRIRNRREGPAT